MDARSDLENGKGAGKREGVLTIPCAILLSKIKSQLIFFPGNHFPLCNPVFRPDCPDQKRGIGIMLFTIVSHSPFIIIGVAVPAAAAAGIISADIQTFHAAAFRPLVLIFFNMKRTLEQALQQASVNAACMFDPVLLQFNSLRAGIHL